MPCGDPFPSRGTVANRMRRCRALFLRERVRLLILDELGNFIDSDISILKINGTQVSDTGKKIKLPGRPASLRGAPK